MVAGGCGVGEENQYSTLDIVYSFVVIYDCVLGVDFVWYVIITLEDKDDVK